MAVELLYSVSQNDSLQFGFDHIALTGLWNKNTTKSGPIEFLLGVIHIFPHVISTFIVRQFFVINCDTNQLSGIS